MFPIHTYHPLLHQYRRERKSCFPPHNTAEGKRANPSLDITVGIDKVKAACDSAKQNPGEENAFRQFRLNQWVKQAVRWMPMEKWDKCAFAVDEDELEGRVCYGGLDLSSTTDITAFVLVFPPSLGGAVSVPHFGDGFATSCCPPLDEEDKYIILPYFWIPEDNLTLRVNRDHVPYDVWERQGYLQTTEKIDGAVATIMALDRTIRCGNDGGASVYDERGLLLL